MKAAAFVVGMLAVVGCVHAAPATTKPADAPVKVEMHVDVPAVEAVFAARKPGKPPLVVIQLDVTLRNAATEARWFLIPKTLGVDAGGESTVNGVEPTEATGTGRAVVGTFLGSDGFHAIQLPAGGQVTLANLPISVWGEIGWKGPLALDVRIAKAVTVGGEPIAAWFRETNALSDKSVTADFSKGSRTTSRFTDDRGEVPVVVTLDRAVAVSVPLK